MVERKQIRITPQQLMQTFVAENSRLEEMNRRINITLMALQEINTAIAGLQALQKAKEKEKMLIPLGAGVFLHAVSEDSQKILFSMAGGILKTKKSEEVKKELEKRKEEIEKNLEIERKEQARLSENTNTLARVISEAQRRNQRNLK